LGLWSHLALRRVNERRDGRIGWRKKITRWVMAWAPIRRISSPKLRCRRLAVADLSAVESIYFGALERASAEERAAYLDAAGGGDAELRKHVERLLRSAISLGLPVSSFAIRATSCSATYRS
jgi:hypothetical protein